MDHTASGTGNVTGGFTRSLLLVCGIVAPVLFAVTEAIAGKLWDGYSFTSQSISELWAADASTRSLVLPLNLVFNAMVIAFGVGVWRSATHNRFLRVTASLIVANAAISSVVIAFLPMRPEESWSELANALHLTLMIIAMLCFVLAVGSGGVARLGWFRFYSVGTFLAYVVLTVVGILLGSRAPAVERSSSVGVQERTMVYGYLLWVVVLAVVLLRRQERRH